MSHWRDEYASIVNSGPMTVSGSGKKSYAGAKKFASKESRVAKPIECKPGQGVLFRRQAEGNRPTLKGACNIDGTDYEIAGWERQSKNGNNYISLQIKVPTAHQQFGDRDDESRGRWQP